MIEVNPSQHRQEPIATDGMAVAGHDEEGSFGVWQPSAEPGAAHKKTRGKRVSTE